jgi:glycerol-3-phosphate O-acyltransferase
VSFAEPVSLAEALGAARERFRVGAAEPEIEDETRRFVQRLGFRLLRDINSAAVAGATAVSATALLGAPRRACRLEDFLRSSAAVMTLLRLQNVRLTPSLVRNEASDFRESLAWLESGGLIERLVDSDGVVLNVPTTKRANLDYYKNNIIHFFLLPALVARALWLGAPRKELAPTVGWWLDLYRWEFPLPARDGLRERVEFWIAQFDQLGVLQGDRLDVAHPVTRVLLAVLENFREGYLVAARTIAGQAQWPVEQGALIESMRQQFATGRLLGEIHKPEGNSVVIFANALLRLGELGMVSVSRRGRREKWVDRGPSFDRLPELVRQLRA